MSREYFNAYHSYLEAMESLNDAERGRLFTALLIYSSTGEAQELRGNERHVFPGMRSQIDRDNEKYRLKCEKNRQNGSSGKSERTRTPPNATERTQTPPKEKEKEKTKDKAKESKDAPARDPLDGFTEPVRKALQEWLAYKAERRESYKPTGMKAFVTEVRNKIAAYGEIEVIALIHECMANGWRGIIWDRLEQKPRGARQQPKKSAASYDKSALEDLLLHDVDRGGS